MSPPRSQTFQDAISGIKSQKILRFYQMAHTFLQGLSPEDRGKLTVLTTEPADKEKLENWTAYFDNHVGARPEMLKRVLSGASKSMTVPTEFPEWLDPTYGKEDERITNDRLRNLGAIADRMTRRTLATEGS